MGELFDAVLDSATGVVFSTSEAADSWDRVSTVDGKLNLAIPEMLAAFADLPPKPEPLTSDEFPFVLAAGARRSFTANTMLSRAEACAAGWGIAPLPCFVAARYPGLVRLDGQPPSPSLWLLVHPELRRSARVRAVMDFLCEAVDAHRDELEGT